MDLDQLYASDKRRSIYLDQAFNQPLLMFMKARIGKNLWKVQSISEVLGPLYDKYESLGISRESFHNLIRHQYEFYEHIVDDAIIFSAFEMYAKALLLKKGYVVHEFTVTDESDPKVKKPLKSTKKTPFLIDDLRSLGDRISLKNKTISGSILLRDGYSKHLGLSDSAKRTLKEINATRNLIHMGTMSGQTISKHLATDLFELKRLICNEIPTQYRDLDFIKPLLEL